MATVYDMAVRKLVAQALALAKSNPGLPSLELEAFKRTMWPPDGEAFRHFGLPAEVLERAIKDAHRHVHAVVRAVTVSKSGSRRNERVD